MKASPVKVLLVDDDQDDFVVTRDLLNDAGAGQYALDWASSFEQGAQMIARGDHDIYLLDYRLGEHTGLELLRQALAAGSRAPFILLTGMGEYEVDLQAMEAGATDYLLKGQISAEVLERAIRYAIERKRAERVEGERQALQETVRAMEQVLGVVGHELRTPLAGLRALSEVLLTEDRCEFDQRLSFIRSINDEVVRMSEMVDNMLEAARLDSGVAKWNWSLVRLHKSCADALDVVRHLVDTQAVELCWRVQPTDLTFNGDGDAVRRLIVNLVSNAIKHTSAGRIDVLGTEVLAGRERQVRIEVSDTGVGMEADTASLLGEAFALNGGVVGSAHARGAGLGLAICRGIVEAHGGRMSVATDVGRGTRMCAVLSADLDGPVTGRGVKIVAEPAS